MRNLILFLSLSAALLLCSCQKEEVVRVTYAELATQPFPAAGGTYIVSTNKAAMGDAVRYSDVSKTPWQFDHATWDEQPWRLSKNKLQIKSSWYKLYWRGDQLYLRLKKNAGKQRQVMIAFRIGEGVFTRSISQQGAD